MAKANANESLDAFTGAFYGTGGPIVPVYAASSQDEEWLGTGSHIQQQPLSQDWWNGFYGDMPFLDNSTSLGLVVNGVEQPLYDEPGSVPVVPVTPAIRPSLLARLFPPRATAAVAPVAAAPVAPSRGRASYVRPSEQSPLQVLASNLRRRGASVTGNDLGYVSSGNDGFSRGALIPTRVLLNRQRNGY